MALWDASDVLRISSPEINSLLTTYQLYSEDPIDQDRATALLAELCLPKLSSTQLGTLNAPIFFEEIVFTFKHLVK